jgi:hypothetical protein
MIETTELLAALRDGDPTMPAERVRQDQALVLADLAAAEQQSEDP